MWFCVKYRKIVEEHIIIDLSTLRRDVKRLWKTMSKELEMNKKCDEPRVR
jgi:hypothetical protein